MSAYLEYFLSSDVIFAAVASFLVGLILYRKDVPPVEILAYALLLTCVLLLIFVAPDIQMRTRGDATAHAIIYAAISLVGIAFSWSMSKFVAMFRGFGKI